MTNRTLPGKWYDNADGTRSYGLKIAGINRRFHEHEGGKRAAQDAYDAWRHLGTSTPAADKRRPFTDVATEYANSRDWAPGSWERFSSSLRTLERHLGKRTRIEQVNEPRLAALRSSLGQEYAVSTANLHLHYATATMQYAYRQSYIPSDVTKAIQPLRDRSGKMAVGPHNVPSRAEVTMIREAVDPRWRLLISLGASGLRISEALGVHAEQFNDGELLVDRQLMHLGGVDSFPLPKREKIRTIVLPEWCSTDLEWHLDNVNDEGLLFRNRLGLPRRRDLAYSAVWKPALVAAGMPANRFKFHSLRHWAASTLLAEGAPLTAVAAYLGDTVETVSRTYAHWCRDEESISAAILSRMLRPQLEVLDGGATRREAR